MQQNKNVIFTEKGQKKKYLTGLSATLNRKQIEFIVLFTGIRFSVTTAFSFGQLCSGTIGRFRFRFRSPKKAVLSFQSFTKFRMSRNSNREETKRFVCRISCLQFLPNLKCGCFVSKVIKVFSWFFFLFHQYVSKYCHF